MLLRQILLCVWGVGATFVAERLLFGSSSNAPVMLFVLPADFIATALVPHMGVVLVSLYLVFALRRWLAAPPLTVVDLHTQRQTAH